MKNVKLRKVFKNFKEKSDVENTVVSYKIAKRLKEMGFDEHCSFYYGSNSRKLLSTVKDVIYSSDELYLDKIILERTDYNSIVNRKLISAPTYKQVLKWFRKKKFNGVVEMVTKNERRCCKFYCEKINSDNKNEILFMRTECNSWKRVYKKLVLKMISEYKRGAKLLE